MPDSVKKSAEEASLQKLEIKIAQLTNTVQQAEKQMANLAGRMDENKAWMSGKAMESLQDPSDFLNNIYEYRIKNWPGQSKRFIEEAPKVQGLLK